MKKYLYMLVTEDQYEYPMVIADSVQELSRICGVSRANIYQMLMLSETKGYKSKYVKVRIDE